MPISEPHVIGVDFGTDSGRAVLVNACTGEERATYVQTYKRWKEGKYCRPEINQFRQHISDHVEVLSEAISHLVGNEIVSPFDIKGICIDTTGSSPIPVGKEGKALCLLPEFENNPNAMMVLWKDHTAMKEADEINRVSRSWVGTDYTKYIGGIYSAEWFWAKILHVAREDAKVKEAAYSWVEHCDLLTYELTGNGNIEKLKRSRCAAGHKAMWHASWGGLPPDDYLSTIDPYLVEVKKNLYSETFTSNQVAGNLNSHWAEKLGLSEEVVVAVGTFDAHAGAVGAGIEPNTLVRVMGTSTCDIIVSPLNTVGDKAVKGICGQVDGSVLPDMIGLEAGQSAFGDALAWLGQVLAWPLDHLLPEELTVEQLDRAKNKLISELSEAAQNTPISLDQPVALDWINGRRTPDANQQLKAAIANLSIGTGAPHLFRALVESICFGSRKIVERFRNEGIEIDNVVGIGGVAKKSDFVMQTLADVLNMPIRIAVSEQAPALGAAMYAAVAANIHRNMREAVTTMASGFEKTYHPILENVETYDQIYQTYCRLGSFVETKINQHV